jgi:hypothetical protein
VAFDTPAGASSTDWVIDAETGAIIAAQYAWVCIDAEGVNGQRN